MREGILRRHNTERWEIVFHEEDTYLITSGDVILVKIGDHWITTRIESFKGGYYPMVKGIWLYEGMTVRVGT